MSSERSIEQYQALLAKVSAKFDEIQSRSGSRMKCAQGCSQCCVPHLTVFAVERENIRRFLQAHPASVAELRALESHDPHKGRRCKFLRANGECAIYEVRPVVCRSHGAPLYSKDANEEVLLDVCPLNFDDLKDLSELDLNDFINLDFLNQLLSLINMQFEPSRQGERFALTVDGLLADKT